MLRKLLAVTIISVIGGAAVSAQESPTAPKDKVGKKSQSFVLTAPFERSYLGVQTVEISSENFAKFGLGQVRGVGVEKVSENSPAAKAGLQSGDVIVRFDGEEVKSVSKLTRLIAEVSPDQTAKITVVRGGSEREFNVTLGKREQSPLPMGNFRFENLPDLQTLPRIQQMPRMQTVPIPPLPRGEGNNGDFFIWRGGASRQIGVSVTELTKQLGDYFGVSEGRGLLINNVREDSPAARAGLKAGDIIIEAEGKSVKGQADLIRAIVENKEGDVSLTIIRDKNRQTIRVTPEAAKNGAIGFDGFENYFEDFPAQMNLQAPKMPITPQTPIAPIQMKLAPRIL